MKKLLIAAAVVVLAATTWYVRSGDTPAASSTSQPAVASTSPPLPAGVDLIAAVKAAGNARDFAAGERLVAASRAAHGVTPENLEAASWLARTALAAEDLDRADRFARETYDLAGGLLQKQPVDAEAHLPIAVGAAIEVLAQVAVRRGARTDAVAFLRREGTTYRNTSVEKRIQKNINLLSLEGTRAPALDLTEHLGPAGRSIQSLEGRVVLMFFWAHWCSDCKAQAPVLAALQTRYANRGLSVVAPTQRFGYVAGGESAPPDRERAYIGEIRQQFYPSLADVPIPLAVSNHVRYGVSTTPTLVLVDRAGVIRLYHPGMMSQAELEPLVRRLLDGRSVSSSTSG